MNSNSIRIYIALTSLWSTAFLSCVGIPPQPPSPLPIRCDSAVAVYTRDWLTQNAAAQMDTLRSDACKQSIEKAQNMASMDSILKRVGVEEFHDFLIRDIIQKDPVCFDKQSLTKSPYPDSLLFPSVKHALLDILK